MLLLKKLQLKNFLSHESTEMNFNEDIKVLFNGMSGAGKSSLVDAIIWAFYGKGRSDNRSLIRRGASTASVVLTFTKDEHTYKIERKATKAGKHELTVCELTEGVFTPIKVNGVKAVQEYLEAKILNSSYLLFVNSVATPQDNTDSFIKQTATKRKDIILEIIKASDYDHYYDVAKDLIRELVGKKSIRETEISGKKEAIAEDSKLVALIPSLKVVVEDVTAQVQKIGQEIAAKRKIQEANTQIEIGAASLKAEKAETVRRLSMNETKADRLTKEITSMKAVDVSVILAGIEKLKEAQAKLVTLQAAQDVYNEFLGKKMKVMSDKPAFFNYQPGIDLLNAKLIKLMGAQPKACVYCSKTDPDWQKEHDAEMITIEAELKVSLNLSATQTEKVTAYEKAIAELGEEPKFDRVNYALVTAEVSSLKHFEEDLASIKTVEANSLAKMEELNLVETEKANDKKRIEELTHTIEKIVSAIIPGVAEEITLLEINEKNLNLREAQAVTGLENALAAQVRVDSFTKNIDTIVKDIAKIESEISSLELIKDAFGNNGLKAIIIDYVIPQLEEKINEILSKLSDFRVALETQHEGVSGDTIIDGLFITITNGQGETFDLANYSGGEKMKINAAISEGLASLQKFGFRIFDESVTGLDATTIDSFVEIMIAIQDKFSQLLCISHLQQVKDIFDNQVTIIKQNGISRIK